MHLKGNFVINLIIKGKFWIKQFKVFWNFNNYGEILLFLKIHCKIRNP